MKKASNGTHPNGNGRRVSFFDAESSEISEESSIRSPSFPSLNSNLMRSHQEKDPFQYYEVMKMVGEGSMGSVCLVKKRESALGGSARKVFVERQKRRKVASILPCFSFCLPGDSSEETKEGALITSPEEDDAISTTSSRSKSSAMVDFAADYGVSYALKSIILNHAKNRVFVEELQNETAILRTLDHPNICKAIETYNFKNRLYLVLELCSGGDLYSRDPYDELQARHIVHSILDACAFLHNRNITHRDLKYENIMFASPTSPHVKIIDFGLSKKYLQNQTMSQTVGTIYTMAPEVIMGKYDELCDVWSVGVLTFMLLSSSLPFFGNSRADVTQRILKGDYYFRSRKWESISQEAKDFISSLLVKDVRQRPSCREALTNKWFKDSKICGRSPNLMADQVVSSAVMDRVQATIQIFSGYTRLKKLALYVIAHKSSADEIGFLQQLFRGRYDVEKDGVVTLAEFKKALSVYSYTNNEIETMFRAMDIDGGEDISYSEFLAATIQAHGFIEEGRIAEAFDRLDSDDSGYISVDNLVDFLGKEVPQEIIDEIIDEADTLSKDHRIDYDEFLGLWDGSFPETLEKTLKEVQEKRRIRDTVLFAEGLEEGEDGEFLEESKKDEPLVSLPPGAGKFFFDQEKEMSTRGIWF